MTKLSERLAGALEFDDVEIPSHITQNLKNDLRFYQINALKHYIKQRQKPNTNHLMFNMATGSGKTLIMAALMLDLYKKGYKNFVFFVNSSSILEKTRANFSDSKSDKYLFADEIIIDSKAVQINVVQNFDESRDDCINIAFNTIQGIYSLFTNERENSLSFADLKPYKIAYIADEAHHLNAETKNQDKLNKDEQDQKASWEGVIKGAFGANDENLLLEFSATIPNDERVQEKYADKIVYEYALKEFYNDKFSKKIFLLKYDNAELVNRLLGAVLLSLFRQLLAQKHGINIKPVILFKSENIKESLENEEIFKSFVNSASAHDIEKFYQNIDLQREELLAQSLEFFRANFDNFYAKLAEFIKVFFKDEFILNVNDTKQASEYQLIVNSLESKNNLVRVIFAVDKLNEGWDVLNLFDIVRCKNKGANSKNITTKEAQLIGRGARYFPFEVKTSDADSGLADFDEKDSNEVDSSEMDSSKIDSGDFARESRFKRKFDESQDELRALEALSYHTINDLEFIKNLNESLENIGLKAEKTKQVELIPNQKICNDEKSFVFVAKNKRVPREKKMGLFAPNTEELKQKFYDLEIPLFDSVSIREKEAFGENNEDKEEALRHKDLKEINKNIIYKAFNRLDIDFESLKKDFVDIKSKENFIEKYLYKTSIKCHKNQHFSRESELKIICYVLENFKMLVEKEREKISYEVTPFELVRFSLQKRIIWTNKEATRMQYDWLLYDKVLNDSNLEIDLLSSIGSIAGQIDSIFDEWFIVRNELYKEFLIFDDRETIEGKENETYSRGLSPDFVLLGKRKGSEIITQCFIEAKGKQLVDYDKWKEDFLRALQDKIVRGDDAKSSVSINGVGFFRQDNKMAFENELIDRLKT